MFPLFFEAVSKHNFGSLIILEVSIAKKNEKCFRHTCFVGKIKECVYISKTHTSAYIQHTLK